MTIITGRTVRLISVVAAVIGLQACDNKQPTDSKPADKKPPVEATATPAPMVAPAPLADTAVVTPPPTPVLSPSELETLLAPVALYPDGVLAQVLAASAKPQEVLDGGNWLLVNDDLRGAALDKAAAAAGFTAPMIALMQFPDVVDMMCMKMDWTTALGEAFLADEPAVLAAVQSLRKKAAAMGNLQNSAQLKIENQTMNNQDVITITSPDPAVVYVPQYDPVATYSTPASSVSAAAPTEPSATTESTATTESDGHSTAALVTTGLLAFGAGILVNEAFNDHDDDDYYPDWGYGGPRYYPAPYYPVYGNGFRPSHQYNNSFNNNNVFINTGKDRYWKQFDNKRPRPVIANRDRDQDRWKGKNTYDGAKLPAREKMVQRAKPATREITRHRPDTASDRGRQPHLQRPDTRKLGQPMAGRQQSVFQGSRNGGQYERAASQRGKASVQRRNDRAGHGGGQRAGGRRR